MTPVVPVYRSRRVLPDEREDLERLAQYTRLQRLWLALPAFWGELERLEMGVANPHAAAPG